MVTNMKEGLLNVHRVLLGLQCELRLMAEIEQEHFNKLLAEEDSTKDDILKTSARRICLLNIYDDLEIVSERLQRMCDLI